MFKTLLFGLGKNKEIVFTLLIGFFLALKTFDIFWEKFGPTAISDGIKEEFRKEIREAEIRSQVYADHKTERVEAVSKAHNEAVMTALEKIDRNILSLQGAVIEIHRDLAREKRANYNKGY